MVLQSVIQLTQCKVHGTDLLSLVILIDFHLSLQKTDCTHRMKSSPHLETISPTEWRVSLILKQSPKRTYVVIVFTVTLVKFKDKHLRGWIAILSANLRSCQTDLEFDGLLVCSCNYLLNWPQWRPWPETIPQWMLFLCWWLCGNNYPDDLPELSSAVWKILGKVNRCQVF